MIAPPSLDLAVIGNCAVAALIDSTGAMVWGCWPRFDADPIFCSLVDGDAPDGGFFSIRIRASSTLNVWMPAATLFRRHPARMSASACWNASGAGGLPSAAATSTTACTAIC